MNFLQTRLVQAAAGPVKILQPESWTLHKSKLSGVLESKGVELIMLSDDDEQPFRTNVVISHEPTTMTIEQLASQCLEQIPQAHAGAFIFDCQPLLAAPHPGRLIEFSYPVNDFSVVTSQWIFATGRRQINITASRATHKLVETDGLLRVIGESVEFAEEA